MARKTKRRGKRPSIRRRRPRPTKRTRRGGGKKSKQLEGRLATAMNRLMACQAELTACQQRIPPPVPPRAGTPAPRPRPNRGRTPSMSSQGSSTYEVPYARARPESDYAIARAAPPSAIYTPARLHMADPLSHYAIAGAAPPTPMAVHRAPAGAPGARGMYASASAIRAPTSHHAQV